MKVQSIDQNMGTGFNCLDFSFGGFEIYFVGQVRKKNFTGVYESMYIS